MSDAATLRRIVGAINYRNPESTAAVATIARHADALVRLVEACERWRSATDALHSASYPIGEADDAEARVNLAATDIVVALIAVHAVSQKTDDNHNPKK